MTTRPASSASPVFYFDLCCPYAYLAAERVTTLLGRPPQWQPVLLRDLLAATGGTSWIDDPTKRLERFRDIEVRASTRPMLPVRVPEIWPVDTRRAMRAATFAAGLGKGSAFALAAFRQIYAAGRDPADDETMILAAAACEIHPRALLKAMERDSVARALATATSQAVADGVTSLPTTTIDGELISGDDGLSTRFG